jgi:DNA-binding phage protein
MRLNKGDYMNIPKLKGKIVENSLSIEKIAKTMGINKSTLYRKLKNNGSDLMIKEVYQIVEILHLTTEDANEIFFG